MELNNMPPTEVVAVTADPKVAAAAFDSILGTREARFTDIEIISGAPRSGRVLYQKPRPRTVPVMPLTGAMVARELLLLMPQARFDPEEDAAAKKGWSIEKAIIDGLPAAIVWCVRVP